MFIMFCQANKLQCNRMKISRRGCRINTGRFRKQALEVQEVFPSENVLDFNSVKSPFLGF